MKIRMTATNIDRLEKGIWWDTVCPGLVLRVGKKRRSFYHKGRVNGANHDDRVGKRPEMTLADARDEIRERIRRLERGQPAPPPSKIMAANGVLTLDGMLGQYERYRRTKGEKIKNLHEQLRVLRVNLDPWLDKPAAEVTKADIKEARDSVAGRGARGASDKLLAYCQPVFKWAAQEDLIDHNFISDILRLGSPRSITRYLDDDEIILLWQATRGANTVSFAAYCRLLRFLLLTGQRLSEAAYMDWADVDGDVWHQADNKASRPHNVQLAPLALACMNGRAEAGLVFAGESGRMSGWTKMKRKLDKRCKITEPWRVHDLRRSFASGLQRLGVDREVIAACLNHSIEGVTSRYMRDKLEPQKREAFHAWADHAGGLVGRPA